MISNSGHVWSVMTLANCIIGVGILAMPFCFQKCGIILSIILIILNNCISRISSHYLIKSSLLTRRKSFELLGLQAFGSSGKLFVELCTIGYLLGTCIMYFVVVGDIAPQIVAKTFNISNKHELRSLVMVAVTVICVLPLALLKNVDSLATICAASVGFYICFVVKIVLESKRHIMTNDWISNIVYWDSGGILQCLPIFSMALSCQMQLFEIFESINNQSIEKLNSLVKNATWICTCVYISVGIFGYIAFYTQPLSGNILIDFSPSFGNDVIKIGFVLSIAFSFPLVIFPCRASIYSLLYRRGHADSSKHIPENRFKSITVFIILISLCIALLLPSVELVIGLVGSTIGVAICVIFPASCFCKISKKESNEKTVAHVILICGFSLMILGTYANLNAIDEKLSVQHHYSALPHNIEPQNIESLHILKVPESAKSLNHIPVQKSSLESEQNLPKDQLQNVVSRGKWKSNTTELNTREVNSSKLSIAATALEKNASHGKSSGASININDNNFQINKSLNFNEKNLMESKANEEKGIDIKKAQNELKRTKDLLAKKVDELKEEIAKQNEETQNFVIEKLDEVVSKVEKIEREVNKKVHAGMLVSPKTNTDHENSNVAQILKKKDSDFEKNIATKNKKMNNSDQHHPFVLPLALLVNISQSEGLEKNNSIIGQDDPEHNQKLSQRIEPLNEKLKI